MNLSGASLAHRLRARRIELRLTLAQVAERSGLSLPYVSNLERGRGNPTVEALTALSSALELSIATLLGEEGDAEDIESVLGDAPKSLLNFSKTERFTTTVVRLAKLQNLTPEEMRLRLLVAMAHAPRRSKGEPNDDDWRRLLDAYSLILGG